MSSAVDLSESLTSLGPFDYENLDQNNVKEFIETAVRHAEVLANSVPVPPSTGSEPSPFSVDSIPSTNSATSAKDTLLDPSDLPLTNLQKEEPDITKPWGKPLKISAKDNPLKVAVYKRAAHDRHGAWFARRSVHGGLGFERWKRAMMREFLESLAVHEGPGSGAVRGISADKRIASHTVEGVGELDIWQLSSAFPGPVAPREFHILNITSDGAATERSDYQGIEKKPRTFFVISRPVTHDDITLANGLVKASYESIEMIREVPVEGAEAEQNPVEWIMVTRSDAGGGIPKFMVERGTPGSIVADVPKWLEWAINKGDIPDSELKVPQEEVDKQNEESHATEEQHKESKASHMGHKATHSIESKVDSVSSTAPQTRLGGLLSSVTHAVEGYLPAYFTHEQALHDDENADSSSITSDSSTGSFRSAVAHEHTHHHHNDPHGVQLAALATQSTSHLDELAHEISERGAKDHHERELLKLQAKREALDAKIAASKASDDKRAEQATEKEEKERQKAEEKLERDRQRQGENYRKALEKLDARRKKEAEKVEERRRKAEAKDALLNARRERDDARERLKVSTEEVELLRAQVDALQRENTALAARMNAGETGADVVRKVRSELDKTGRSRAASKSSKRSADSASIRASVDKGCGP